MHLRKTGEYRKVSLLTRISFRLFRRICRPAFRGGFLLMGSGCLGLADRDRTRRIARTWRACPIIVSSSTRQAVTLVPAPSRWRLARAGEVRNGEIPAVRGGDSAMP